jgi:hypothetical protein
MAESRNVTLHVSPEADDVDQIQSALIDKNIVWYVYKEDDYQ